MNNKCSESRQLLLLFLAKIAQIPTIIHHLEASFIQHTGTIKVVSCPNANRRSEISSWRWIRLEDRVFQAN